MSNFGYEYNGYQTATYGGMDPMGGFDGGFMGGGGGGDDGAGKSVEKKGNREKQTCLPLTIKAFSDASYTNETFQVDGCDLYNVRILGWIEQIDSRSTFTNVQIHDGTGVVECKFYNKGELWNQDLRENVFVRVVGSPRSYDGTRAIIIYDIVKVEDMNELTHHLLECVLTHLQLTKGPTAGAGDAAGFGMGIKPSMASGMSWGTPSGGKGQQPSQSQFGYSNSAASMGGANNGASDLERKVYNCFKEGQDNDAGLSVDQVFNLLKQRNVPITRMQLDKTVLELTDKAFLYSTTDDSHYKPTDEGFMM